MLARCFRVGNLSGTVWAAYGKEEEGVRGEVHARSTRPLYEKVYEGGAGDPCVDYRRM